MAGTIGRFYPGRSPLHALDPRAKIVCSVVFVVGIFVVGSLPSFVFVAAVVLTLLFVSRVPVSAFLGFLKPVAFIMALTFIFQALFSRQGDLLIGWSVFQVHDEGLINGFFLAARIMLLVLSAALLTSTTPPVALTDGIEDLLSPLKRVRFPAHEVAMMMTIALRFIPTLDEETQKIMRAQAARGADFSEGGLIRRGRAIVPILIPLTIGAFRRADELAEAMESRGYRGGEGRSRYRQLSFGKRDVLALILTAGIVAIAALL